MRAATTPLLALAASSIVSAGLISPRASHSDPCAAIAGQAYVDPALALGCLKSFPVNETIKENVLAVVSGALDFFTFEAEQIHAPAPFQESSVNLRAQLARIAKTKYAVSTRWFDCVVQRAWMLKSCSVLADRL